MSADPRGGIAMSSSTRCRYARSGHARRRFALVCCAALALGVVVGPPSPADAWRDKGHRVAGHVARDLLTPSARAALVHLMGDDDLATFAIYLDEHADDLDRQIPGSRGWHYDNVPVCPMTARSHFCASGNCASRQIPRHRQILADSRASTDDRQLAVRVLAHVIADIHQPLHAGDNGDRGGNDIPVRLPDGREGNLHWAWDGALVSASFAGRSNVKIAKELERTFGARAAGWRSGDVESWIAESSAIARTTAYGTLPGFACGARPRFSTPISLPREYARNAEAVIREQLAKAGYRLAYVLNSALDARR